MHAARLDKSERLRRVLMVLEQYGQLTTMDIIKLADVCAVNSIISELRRNGYHIPCECLDKGVFRYGPVSKAAA